MRVFKTNRDNLMFIFKIFSVVSWNLNCSLIKKQKEMTAQNNSNDI